MGDRRRVRTRRDESVPRGGTFAIVAAMGLRLPLGVLVLTVAWASGAGAQDLVRVEGADGAQRSALEDRARSEGWAPIGTPAPARLERAAVVALARAERLVVEARRAAAQLREGEALGALEEARQLVERNAHVPGAAGWLAEVELATGIVAHQQGHEGLAEQSLGRAASLDPQRTLGAAEAPPAIVARARELAREAASRTRTEVGFATDVPGARLYLDDRAVGSLPLRRPLPLGRHVVRIEAPGHVTWARVVDLREGRHGTWRVALSPTGSEVRRQRLASVALADLPAALAPGEALLWVEVVGDRVFTLRCRREGCSAPATDPLGGTEGAHVRAAGPFTGAEARRLLAALRVAPERAAPAEPPPGRRPWWRRGTTWVAAALGLIVAGVAIGFAARPETRERFQVVVDTSGL